MISISASLRIAGDFSPEKITEELEISPTHSHRKGELDDIGKKYTEDLWLLESEIDENEPLENHLLWIKDKVKGKYDKIKLLKSNLEIDVYCGITSIDISGFRLSSKALSIFSQLQIDLEVSLILFEG